MDGDEVLTFSMNGMPEDSHVKTSVVTSIGIDHPLSAERDAISILNEINVALVGIMERFEPLFE